MREKHSTVVNPKTQWHKVALKQQLGLNEVHYSPSYKSLLPHMILDTAYYRLSISDSVFIVTIAALIGAINIGGPRLRPR